MHTSSVAAQGFVGELTEQGGWLCYPAKRFKTITLEAFWINPLKPEEAALAALLPYVLRRATQKWPTMAAIERRLEELYGAGFRSDVGKAGDRQLLSFHLELVNGRFLPESPDTLSAGLDFLQEVLEHPLTAGVSAFDPEVVAREQEVLARRIGALINDKSQYAMQRLLESVAEGRPFGLRRLGTVEAVRAITPEALYSFYRKVRETRPFMLLVVGDVNPDTVGAFYQKMVNGRRAVSALPPSPAYTPLHRDRVVVERQDVRQGKLNMAYATSMTVNDPRWPALMMYAGILGGFPHSKLFVNVREKASLAYYAFARIDAALGMMAIGAGIEFEDYAAASRIIREQVEAMARGEITDEEMAFTLDGFGNEILSEQDSPDAIIGRQMERILSGGGLAGDDLIAALSRVTREDMVAVAREITLDTTFFLTNTDAKEVP